MQNNVTQLNRRRMERAPVNFAAQLRQGDLLIDGRVCDFTPLGVRFEAGLSFAEGFRLGGEALAELGSGPVSVALLDHSGCEVAVFPGDVRWADGEFCGIANLAVDARLAA